MEKCYLWLKVVDAPEMQVETIQNQEQQFSIPTQNVPLNTQDLGIVASGATIRFSTGTVWQVKDGNTSSNKGVKLTVGFADVGGSPYVHCRGLPFGTTLSDAQAWPTSVDGNKYFANALSRHLISIDVAFS